MTLIVSGDEAVEFLEDHGLSEKEATDTVRKLSGGGLFAARFTVRGWAHIKRAADGQNTIPGKFEIDSGEPTAEMLYAHTLDNLFTGEHSGQEDAPTGWFAKVKWPWDGQGWYLVTHDERGTSAIVAQGEDPVNAVYKFLEEEYERWGGDDVE